MRKLILLAALLLSSAAIAQQWEYKVVYLEPTIEDWKQPDKLKSSVQKRNGYATNTQINNVLNKLGEDAWELISVTGNNMSQTAFMRRQID